MPDNRVSSADHPSSSSWVSRRFHDLALRIYLPSPPVMMLLPGAGASLILVAAQLPRPIAGWTALAGLVIIVAAVLVLVAAIATMQSAAASGLIEAAYRRVGADNVDLLSERLVELTRTRLVSRSAVAREAHQLAIEHGREAQRKQALEAKLHQAQLETIARW